GGQLQPVGSRGYRWLLRPNGERSFRPGFQLHAFVGVWPRERASGAYRLQECADGDEAFGRSGGSRADAERPQAIDDAREHAADALRRHANRSCGTEGFSPFRLAVLELYMRDPAQNRDAVLTRLECPNELPRHLPRGEGMLRDHQDDCLGLMDRLTGLDEVGGSRNAVELVTPRRVPALPEGMSDLKGEVGVLFDVGDEDVAH